MLRFQQNTLNPRFAAQGRIGIALSERTRQARSCNGSHDVFRKNYFISAVCNEAGEKTCLTMSCIFSASLFCFFSPPPSNSSSVSPCSSAPRKISFSSLSPTSVATCFCSIKESMSARFRTTQIDVTCGVLLLTQRKHINEPRIARTQFRRL